MSENSEYNGIPNVDTDVTQEQDTAMQEAKGLAEAAATCECAVQEAAPASAPKPLPDIVWDPQKKVWVNRSELPPTPTPEPPPKRTKVAIVGFASHWKQAPFDDPEFEIWTLNEFYDVAPSHIQLARQQGRLRWFELHSRETQYAENPFGSRNSANEHAAKMAALDCPVYMHQHWDDIPRSIPYPKDEMLQRFATRYFTNSVSWMLALAITEGFTDIHVYGVDMAQSTEYASQRPSCEFFLGWARALGVRVHMPAECDLLLASYLYGFEEEQQSETKAKIVAREKELQARYDSNASQGRQLEAHQNQLIGALENTRYMKEILTRP